MRNVGGTYIKEIDNGNIDLQLGRSVTKKGRNKRKVLMRHLLTGNIIYFDTDQPSRVLPTGGGDYTTHIAGCALVGKISHICNDTRVDQVNKY